MALKNAARVGSFIAVWFTASLAAPKLKVETAEFDVGVIIEGTREKVRHEFILTNIGDDVLRIKDVRAG